MSEIEKQDDTPEEIHGSGYSDPRAAFSRRVGEFREALSLLYIRNNASGRNKFRMKWPEIAEHIFGAELIEIDNEGTQDRARRAELENEAGLRRIKLKKLVEEYEDKSVKSGALEFEYVGEVIDKVGPGIAVLLYAEEIVERVRPGLLATLSAAAEEGSGEAGVVSQAAPPVSAESMVSVEGAEGISAPSEEAERDIAAQEKEALRNPPVSEMPIEQSVRPSVDAPSIEIGEDVRPIETPVPQSADLGRDIPGGDAVGQVAGEGGAMPAVEAVPPAPQAPQPPEWNLVESQKIEMAPSPPPEPSQQEVPVAEQASQVSSQAASGVSPVIPEGGQPQPHSSGYVEDVRPSVMDVSAPPPPVAQEPEAGLGGTILGTLGAEARSIVQEPLVQQSGAALSAPSDVPPMTSPEPGEQNLPVQNVQETVHVAHPIEPQTEIAGLQPQGEGEYHVSPETAAQQEPVAGDGLHLSVEVAPSSPPVASSSEVALGGAPQGETDSALPSHHDAPPAPVIQSSDVASAPDTGAAQFSGGYPSGVAGGQEFAVQHDMQPEEQDDNRINKPELARKEEGEENSSDAESSDKITGGNHQS